MAKNKKNKLPKISIVTVCLNSEKTINKCIDSINKQKYPKNKIEHIIIDGGSKDKTISLIKKKIKNPNYFFSEKNKGIYDAMNKGIKKCNGEIIGILNSDDYFYNNALNIVSDYFNKYSIDYLFGSVLKKRIYHNFKPQKLWYTFNFYPSHSVSFFIKKKAQTKIGYYDTQFKYSADRDLFYRIIRFSNLKGKSTKKSEVLGKFYMGGTSSKVSFFRKNLEEIKIRINNKQNFFEIFFVFIIYCFYYLFRLGFKKN